MNNKVQSNVEQGKNTINLLQAALLPQQVLVTLKRVTLAWFLLLLIAVITIFMIQYQQNQKTMQLTLLSAQQVQQNTQIAHLQAEAAKNKPDTVLTSHLAMLKSVLANKKALHAELTNKNSTYVAGFAKAMTELSAMHSKDISLQRVEINNQQMVFSGMAKAPESVPIWLAQFETSTVLSGKVFSHMNLKENESHYIDFVVSTVQSKNQGSR